MLLFIYSVLILLSTRRNKDLYIMIGDGLLKDVIEGRMEGKRTRGRRRICMIDELMEGTYGQM